MTTTPVPPAGPALDPSGSPAPRDLLTTALGRLVSDGTLTGAQADAVLAAVAGAGHPPTAQ
ncbi:MAG: hypothetical protein J0I40_13350, partial [Cellulomonas sp.]|nr:hypothetical protein [Cellulomonas sp.]